MFLGTLSSTFHIKFYFTGKRQRKSAKNVSKRCHWKIIFVIWSYSTWARRHARHVGTWAREHARHVDTWLHKHRRHVGLARWHVNTQGPLARKYATRVGTWARKPRSLADSRTRHIKMTLCLSVTVRKKSLI